MRWSTLSPSAHEFFRARNDDIKASLARTDDLDAFEPVVMGLGADMDAEALRLAFAMPALIKDVYGEPRLAWVSKDGWGDSVLDGICALHPYGEAFRTSQTWLHRLYAYRQQLHEPSVQMKRR